MSALHSLLRERGLKPTYVVKSGSLLSLFFLPVRTPQKNRRGFLVSLLYISEHFGAFRNISQKHTNKHYLHLHSITN